MKTKGRKFTFLPTTLRMAVVSMSVNVLHCLLWLHLVIKFQKEKVYSCHAKLTKISIFGPVSPFCAGRPLSPLPRPAGRWPSAPPAEGETC